MRIVSTPEIAPQEVALTVAPALQAIVPSEFFKPRASDELLSRLEAEVRTIAASLDISTDKGRAEIASLAYKVARTKTGLDEEGKRLVEGKKAEVKAVDQERARIWDRVESLQKEVRKPLTEWESAEKARVASQEEHIRTLRSFSSFEVAPTVADIEMAISAAKLSADGRNWEEFKKPAMDARSAVLFELGEMLTAAKKAEADRIEAERLAEESRDRAIRDREEAAAKAAKEEAERKAAEQATIARDAAESAQRRVENERIEAEARAKQAEAQRIAAEEKAARDLAEAEERRKREAEYAEQKRIAAEKEAQRQAQLAKEKAERDRLAAVEAERRRVAEEARKVREEAEARERNKAHRAKINSAAKKAFIAAGMSDDTAELAVTVIAKGLVPNVTIAY